MLNATTTSGGERPRNSVGYVAVVVGVALVLCGLWTLLLGYPSSFSVDAVPTWLAGRAWLMGHPEAVYHPETQFLTAELAHPVWSELQREHGVVPLAETSFVYNPAYLALLLPVIHVLPLGWFLWGVRLVIGVAAGVVGQEAGELAGIRSTVLRGGVGLLVGLSGVGASGAWHGQNTLIALALVLLALRLWTGEGWRRLFAVLLLSVAVLAKPWILLLALGCLAAIRAWSAIGVAAAIGVTLEYLVPLLFPVRELASGYAGVRSMLLWSSPLARSNVSLRAFLHRLFVGDWAAADGTLQGWVVPTPVFGFEVAIVLLGIALFLAWVWTRDVPRDHVAAAVLAMVPLVLGVCWTHYLVFAVPLTLAAIMSGRMVPRVLGLASAIMLVWMPLQPFEMVIIHSLSPISYHLVELRLRPEMIRSAPALFGVLFFLPAVLLGVLSAVLLVSAGAADES